MRIALAPISTDMLPAVKPSFGDAEVSVGRVTTRSSATSSSSAATWAIAVTMPCPISTLPERMVTA